MTFIDTNIVLRWILDDHPALSARARKIINGAGEAGLLITDIVLAEVFYVLRGSRGLSNRQVAAVFDELLAQPVFIFDNETRLSRQVDITRETNLDFADCYLISRAIHAGESLQTFDKPMLRAYNKYRPTSK